MVGVSLVVLTGWGGHISLGQFAIVGVGAVVAGNLVADPTSTCSSRCSSPAPPARSSPLVVGLPALRIQGLFLAVTTLAFAVALDQLRSSTPTNFPDLIPTDVGAPDPVGALRPRRRTTPCTSRASRSSACRSSPPSGVRKARSGRVVIATRDNQRAADAAAVPTTNVKLSAFLLAGVDRRHRRRAARACSSHASGQNSPTARSTVAHRVHHRGDRRPRLDRRRRPRRARCSVPRDAHGPRRPPPRSSPASACSSCSTRCPAASASCCSTSATATCAGSPTAAASSCRAWSPTSGSRSDGEHTPPTRSTSSSGALEPGASRPSGAGRRDAHRRDPRARPPTRTSRCSHCRGVDVAYGPVQILFGVDFDVHAGRDRRPARHQRRRQVDAAQGHLRPGEAQAPAPCTSTARTSPTCRPTSPPTAASR